MAIVILLILALSIVLTAFALSASAALPLWQQLLLALVPQGLNLVLGFVLGRWEPAQLLWHHFLGWVLNRVSEWSLLAEYRIRDGKNAIQEATKTILTRPNSELWQDDSTQKVIHTQGFTIRIYLSPTSSFEGEMEQEIMYCKLTDMHIPYRQSRRLLNQTILPLFVELENKLRPKSQMYELRIAFSEANNPYYGFFVKRVPVAMMHDFELEFDVHLQGQTNSIAVGKDNICVIAKHPIPLIQLAMHYLSFSSSPFPASSSSSPAR